MPIPEHGQDREGNEGIRVEDRRAFDSSGQRREQEAGASPPQGEQEKRAPDEGLRVELTPFLRLVQGIAAGALMALGYIGDPSQDPPPVDMDAAKESIGLLEVLADKTRGNLEPAEEEQLQKTLNELRLLFVRRHEEGGHTS